MFLYKLNRVLLDFQLGGAMLPYGTWRREWDSNPRYRFRHDGFQDRYLQPLGHLSVRSATSSIIYDFGGERGIRTLAGTLAPLTI